jgi:hypothetical protein
VRRVVAFLLVGSACGSGAAAPSAPDPSTAAPARTATSSATAPSATAGAESVAYFVDEREVDRATFEASHAKLEVDREPWKTRVTEPAAGTHGFTAIFHAIDRATGDPWTYLETSQGSGPRAITKHLTRGSSKPPDPPPP